MTRVGVHYPQGEIPPDGASAIAFARAVEEGGYDHLLVLDHVVGADAASRPGWTGPLDVGAEIHEPIVLLSHLAAVTRLEVVTNVLVLPQRQAALVAKQAATLDLLTGGRLRLGVGIGWNEVEYEALGTRFGDRAARLEEQVAVLRALWTNRVVDFTDRWHRVDRAGIAPLPVQRPIPLWFGTFARAEAPLRRIGRLGDGWMPTAIAPGAELAQAKRIVDRAAEEAGRDPASIGLEGRIEVRDETSIERVPELAQRWREHGASHLTVVTARRGLGLQGHIERLGRVAEALDMAT